MYGPLGDELVGRDPEALEQRRVDAEARDPHHAQHDQARHQEAPARPEDLEDARGRAEQRERGEHAEHRQRRVHVGVGGAEDDAARRVEQIEAVEPEPDAAQQEQQRAPGRAGGCGRPRPGAAPAR